MKTSLVAAMAVGIGLVIVVSGFLYQETYNQNCEKEGGKITEFLRCTVVFDDFADPLSKYDVDYDELVTRNVWVIAKPSIQIVPELNCDKFTQFEIEKLPEMVRHVITVSSDQLDEFYEDYDKDGFLDGFRDTISFDDAISLLERYNFQLIIHEFEGGYPKQQDAKYYFECIFEDDSHQYKVILEFDSHYDVYGRLVFVNFTKNEQGFPIIENDHVRLFTGGFNQTVVFRNNLNHEIILEIINPPTSEGRERIVPDKIAIPAGKVWSHFFFRGNYGDPLVYQYNTEPDNLNGIVTLNNYPRCMTENEIRSLYSQVDAYPKFPSYLPEGYSFECGVHNMNAFVHLGYWNDELREKFEDKVNYSNNMEFFASGGLTIDYYNEYIINSWTTNPDYDKYEKAKERAEHPRSKTLTIAGEPAVLRQQSFWKNGEQYSFNELIILLDGEIQYRVRSGLPESEIINIAESLFT